MIILYIQIGILLITIYLLYKKNIIVEGMTNSVNPEALANLSAMYNNGKLKVSELEVTGRSNLKGGINGTTVHGGLDVTGRSNLKGGINGTTVHGGLDVTGRSNLKGGINGTTIHGGLNVTGNISVKGLNISGKKPVLKGEIINITMKGTNNNTWAEHKNKTLGIWKDGYMASVKDENITPENWRIGDFRIIDPTPKTGHRSK
ncbi:MAG: hypothetical protein CMF62_02875 [Magnetococcales bacterium]|nr:hypothetical protein [Magnetococcales bacterium]